jgi:hypothetical protein
VANEVPDEVPADCVVYRMVRRAELKDNGEFQSPNFTDKGDYMSVYFEDGMRAEGKTVEDLEKHWGENYEAVAFKASELRRSGEAVWRDANDEFPGHGAVKRQDSSRRSTKQKHDLAKMAKRRPWFTE